MSVSGDTGSISSNQNNEYTHLLQQHQDDALTKARLPIQHQPSQIPFHGGHYIKRYTSNVSYASDAVSLMSDSYHNYQSNVHESFIQTRRNSLLSSRLSSLHLAPRKTTENGPILEAETTLGTELPMLLKQSVPLIVTFLLQYSLTVASVFSVGNLGSRELSAVSIANLLVNIACYGIIQGIASSLSTLCPQAFGRKEYQTVGTQCLRCLMLLFTVFIPIFYSLYFYSFSFLSSIVPDIELCILGMKFTRRLLWGVPAFIVFEVNKQYLQAQGIFQASTAVLLFCAPLNLFLNFFFVWDPKFGMGFIGAPTAVLITNYVMAAMLLFYSTFINGYQCWCGFSFEAFRHWDRIFRLALPGILLIESEWLFHEVITFAASRFGTVALAAQSVVATICIIMFQVPQAISVTASIRIAWFIGSASKTASVVSTKSAMIGAMVAATFNSCVIYFCRRSFASLFSNEEDVIDLASKILIMGACNQIVDVVACVTSGTLRGQGRQHIAGWTNVICYYFLALPISFFLAFKCDMHLVGLWIGMFVGVTVNSIMELYYVVNSDYDEIIRQSIEDGLAEQELEMGYDDYDDESNFLVPVRSIISATNSVIEHNMTNPAITTSRGEALGITSLILGEN